MACEYKTGQDFNDEAFLIEFPLKLRANRRSGRDRVWLPSGEGVGQWSAGLHPEVATNLELTGTANRLHMYAMCHRT